MIMLGSEKDDEYGHRFKTPEDVGGFETSGAYIIVVDADAVYAKAKAVGGVIIREIAEHRLRQPRVHGEGPGGTFVERGHVRSVEGAELRNQGIGIGD